MLKLCGLVQYLLVFSRWGGGNFAGTYLLLFPKGEFPNLGGIGLKMSFNDILSLKKLQNSNIELLSIKIVYIFFILKLKLPYNGVTSPIFAFLLPFCQISQITPYF